MSGLYYQYRYNINRTLPWDPRLPQALNPSFMASQLVLVIWNLSECATLKHSVNYSGCRGAWFENHILGSCLFFIFFTSYCGQWNIFLNKDTHINHHKDNRVLLFPHMVLSVCCVQFSYAQLGTERIHTQCTESRRWVRRVNRGPTEMFCPRALLIWPCVEPVSQNNIFQWKCLF